MQQMITCALQLMEIPRGNGSFVPSLLPEGPLCDYCSSQVRQITISWTKCYRKMMKMN